MVIPCAFNFSLTVGCKFALPNPNKSETNYYRTFSKISFNLNIHLTTLNIIAKIESNIFIWIMIQKILLKVKSRIQKK